MVFVPLFTLAFNGYLQQFFPNLNLGLLVLFLFIPVWIWIDAKYGALASVLYSLGYTINRDILLTYDTLFGLSTCSFYLLASLIFLALALAGHLSESKIKIHLLTLWMIPLEPLLSLAIIFQ